MVGIVVTSLVTNRMWKDLDDDPEVQARIALGRAGVAARRRGGGHRIGCARGRGRPQPTQAGASGSAGPDSATPQLTYTARGRNSALVFFAGVIAIVILGLFPDLRPSFDVEGEGAVPIDMTTTIVLVMFVVGAIILYVGRPNVTIVPDQSVFKAGMISAIALFGIAWLTATFISAHEDYIIGTIGEWVTNWEFLFAIAVFLVAALTTSQSTATRTIVPIGLAAGLPPGS